MMKTRNSATNSGGKRSRLAAVPQAIPDSIFYDRSNEENVAHSLARTTQLTANRDSLGPTPPSKQWEDLFRQGRRTMHVPHA